MGKLKNKDSVLWDFHQSENRSHLYQNRPRLDFLYKIIIQNLSKDSKILEIGFGDGYLLYKLSNYFKKNNLFGSDISSENIKITKSKLEKINFSLIVDNKINFDNSSFDCIIATEVLEHMDDDELIAYINEFSRILKKNGLIFLTFPAQEKLSENFCFCPNCNTKFHKWGHKQSWDINKIHNLFNNFKFIKCEKFFFKTSGLNFFGKVQYYSKVFFSYFNKNLSGGTYLLILKK